MYYLTPIATWRKIFSVIPSTNIRTFGKFQKKEHSKFSYVVGGTDEILQSSNIRQRNAHEILPRLNIRRRKTQNSPVGLEFKYSCGKNLQNFLKFEQIFWFIGD